MKPNAQEQQIAKIIHPVIADLGFELIQVRVIGSQKMQTLQIMAEDEKTGLLDLNACTAISRAVSAILDVEDPISSAYQLEISSPGIDRPLVREKDFEKWIGFEASIEIVEPIEATGQKRFKGLLKSFKDKTITIEDDTSSSQEIEFDTILKAKLILTDDLLHLHNPKQTKKTLNKKVKNTDSTQKTKPEKVRTA